MNLKKKMENYYNVKFNFDDKFLLYPYTKKIEIKKYKDLLF